MTRLTATDVLKQLEQFKGWLSSHGAEVLEPTNEYEVVRFKTGKGTSVIYRKKVLSGNCSFIGDAEVAWREFKLPQSSWRAVPRTKRSKTTDSVEYTTIRKRDGDNCFFCNHFVAHNVGTIEHLVALTHGGPQHISNKYLAHKDCNARAGHLSAVEKIKIHTKAVILKEQNVSDTNAFR